MFAARSMIVFGITLVACLGPGARFSGAQQPVRIETVYPRHVARGQTTVINVAIVSADVVQAAEISPSTGVTVSGIKGSGSETEQDIGWWEITLDVAKDAAPGDRSLVTRDADGSSHRFPQRSRFRPTFPASPISGSRRHSRISQRSNCNWLLLTRLAILVIHRMSGLRPAAAVNRSSAQSKAR